MANPEHALRRPQFPWCPSDCRVKSSTPAKSICTGVGLSLAQQFNRPTLP